MKVPGAAILEFEVEPREGGGANLLQRASFTPNSSWGRVYWDVMRPMHAFVFRGMADGIVRTAESFSNA